MFTVWKYLDEGEVRHLMRGKDTPLCKPNGYYLPVWRDDIVVLKARRPCKYCLKTLARITGK